MKNIYALFPLLSAIIVFLLGYNALKADNLREGILWMSLSIILFGSAGTLKIFLEINDLKEEIKNKNSDSKTNN